MSSNFFDIDNKALSDVDGNTVFAKGTTVPSSASGYAIGCLFLKTDGSTGTSLYVNEGSTTTSDFNAVIPTGGGSDASFGILTQTGEVLAYTTETGTALTLTTANNVVDFTGTASTIILKVPTTAAGTIFRLVNSRSTAQVQVIGDSGETVDATTTFKLLASTGIVIVSDATNYKLIANS